MAPTISEDEIDDLLYLARSGETSEFQTVVAEICTRLNVSLAQLLVDARDAYTGNGPLHMAAANGHVDTLRAILKGISTPPTTEPTSTSTATPTSTSLTPQPLLNAQNIAGNTPLHWAALNGHLPAVMALLDAGADPTITNKAGHDAVYEAELNDRTEVVEWVLKESEGLEEGIAGVGGEGEAEGEDVDEEMEVGGVQGQGQEQEQAGGSSSLEENLKDGLRKLGLADSEEKKTSSSSSS